MKATNDVKPVEIFRGSTWEAGMLKSLLENAEVETFLYDEVIGLIVPFQTSPGGVGPVKVMVSSADIEKAMQVVYDFSK